MRLRIGGQVPGRSPGKVESHCVVRSSKTNTFAGLGEIPINQTIPTRVKYRKGHSHHCRHRSKLARQNLLHRVRPGEPETVEVRKTLERARVLSLQIDRMEDPRVIDRKMTEYVELVRDLRNSDSRYLLKLIELERARGVVRAARV